MQRHIAIYLRVSTKRQDTRSQEPDLQRWIEAFAGDAEVKWYRDKATGSILLSASEGGLCFNPDGLRERGHF
jgi:DNA invertase Pin-like site-specific DNA recombinase